MSSATPSSPTPTGDSPGESASPESGATAAEAVPGGASQPTTEASPSARARGRGNWRSLLLSTAAVGALLFVIYAIVPRPDSVTQPPVDVTPVARQLAEENDATVWIPQLGEPGRPWKATSVRRGTDPTSWYAGYVRTDDETVFVAVQQIPATTPADKADAWRAEALSHGRQDGTSSVAGTTWTRFTTDGDPARRGLLGTRGEMTTVVSGLADYATLESFAASLRPYTE